MSPKMVPAQPWAAPHGYLYFPCSEIEDVSTDQLHLDIWYRPCALQAGAVGASGLRVVGGGTQAGLGSTSRVPTSSGTMTMMCPWWRHAGS